MDSILNLPHWNVIHVKQNEHDYLLFAEYTEHATHCPACSFFADIKKHGTKTILLMDLPVHGKRVGIQVPRQRYRCGNCGKTFFQKLPDKHPNHLMTKRLVSYIERECFRKTFIDIQDDTGVDERTVRGIFRDYVKRKEKEIVIVTPQWLGIDEVHLLGKPRCILANVKDRTIVDLMRTRRKDVVTKRLMRLPGRKQIELVTMDMWNPYRLAAQAALSQAVIVIDKFHVVRMANDAMETVRKQLRADLEQKQRRGLMHDRFILLKRKAKLDERELLLFQVWTERFPILGTVHELKEDFFGIWDDAKDSGDAQKQFDEWKERIPENAKEAFDPLLTAFGNWSTEIFAYFDYDATNAYTEALNGLTKITNRIGRGHSFEVLRAKMLYGRGLGVRRRPGFGSHFERTSERLAGYLEPEPWLSDGMPISAIVENVRDGHFDL